MHWLGFVVVALGIVIILDADGLVSRLSELWVSATERFRQRVRKSSWRTTVAGNRSIAIERTMAAWRVSGFLLVLAGAGVVLSSLQTG